MSVLIVVPMRADSRGIPGKHLKLLGGIPVAQRVLTVLQSIEDARLLVSTNDPTVRSLVHDLHVECIVRPANLCAPEVTLDPVAHHAWLVSGKPDVLVTVQATAPFLQAETVRAAIAAVRLGEYDTATVVVDDRHLRWEEVQWLEATGNRGSKMMAPARVNRQQMPPAWRETAAVCATRGEYVRPTSRFGPRVKLIEVSGAEAVDLDSPEDWAVAEWYAGVPSNRECLMARVLGEQKIQGEVVLLSAWDEPPIDEVLRDYWHRSLAEPYVRHIRAANTYDEAVEAITGRTQDDLTIMTSAYHQVRAFLTFLHALQDRMLDRTVRLWNAPAPSRMEPLAIEWAKITAYQTKGHVASYEAGIEYLNWRDALVTACVT